MGNPIIKIKDKYFEWSTIVDAPVSRGVTKEELKGYIKRKYGEKGLSELHERLKRVEDKGTSSYVTDLEGLINCNRAGENEETLTKEEIYNKYTKGDDLNG
jgi:RNase P/RNase MRP subunit POP5